MAGARRGGRRGLADDGMGRMASCCAKSSSSPSKCNSSWSAAAASFSEERP